MRRGVAAWVLAAALAFVQVSCNGEDDTNGGADVSTDDADAGRKRNDCDKECSAIYHCCWADLVALLSPEEASSTCLQLETFLGERQSGPMCTYCFNDELAHDFVSFGLSDPVEGADLCDMADNIYTTPGYCPTDVMDHVDTHVVSGLGQDACAAEVVSVKREVCASALVVDLGDRSLTLVGNGPCSRQTLHLMANLIISRL